MNSPARVLVDTSGSQVGTVASPFVISSSNPLVNVYTGDFVTVISSSGADPYAKYILEATTGSLVSGSAHRTLRHLVHMSDDDGPRGLQWPDDTFRECGPRPFITRSIWWTDVSRTTKIMEQIIVRNSNKTPSTIQWIVYDADGSTPVDSYTDTITYSGIIEISRIRSNT